MELYYVHPSALWKTSDGSHMGAYLANEVDARIEQLERALKCCAAVLVRQITASEISVKHAREAVGEADKALALMVP